MMLYSFGRVSVLFSSLIFSPQSKILFSKFAGEGLICYSNVLQLLISLSAPDLNIHLQEVLRALNETMSKLVCYREPSNEGVLICNEKN